MAEYLGLARIAARLGYCTHTIRKMHAVEGLPLYRQRLRRVRPGARGWAWATTDELLQAWLLARCTVDRQFIPSGADRRPNRVHDRGTPER